MPLFPETPVRGGWTDARVAKLTELWREGLSASMVAARLGVSRNAIIGKVHRLGLSKSGEHDLARPKPVRPTRPKAPRRLARAHPKPAPRPTPQVLVASIDLPGLVDRLEDLGAHACHFPVGDPQAADFAFCGRLRSQGPYCEDHRQIAYQPGGPKPVLGLIRRFAAG
jgi:GcrA cell cycle regulator